MREVRFSTTINGTSYEVVLDARVSVLDLSREHPALTGTRKGCEQGACGACTVLIEGRRILACLTLAVQCAGKHLTTIEGLSRPGDRLHPMQEAFVRADGFQ